MMMNMKPFCQAASNTDLTMKTGEQVREQIGHVQKSLLSALRSQAAGMGSHNDVDGRAAWCASKRCAAGEVGCSAVDERNPLWYASYL